ncbi:DUF3343 domain-containing protein [Eubacterium sp. 1001713B170207_170306_E7]|uniref:DUF3343 domain-containing protein n=1 Tax=Eubacterium sp. 1001713B170207_170306_E7 TaxID=2787097 RepID=UPI0018980BD4|nr:DUF3343 domain-containing protein [Eubacterium sp. 1001713B170207_170306_E7]
MKRQMDCLLTFANTHAAMTAEGILKGVFNIRIVPTLREISAGCGISISIEAADVENVLKQLASANFDEGLMEVYAVYYNDGKACPEPMNLK